MRRRGAFTRGTANDRRHGYDVKAEADRTMDIIHAIGRGERPIEEFDAQVARLGVLLAAMRAEPL